jgi:hypothetical protein
MSGTGLIQCTYWEYQDDHMILYKNFIITHDTDRPVFHLIVLEIEFWVLHLLGWLSATWAALPVLSAAGLDHEPPVGASPQSWSMFMSPCTAPHWDRVSLNFPQTSLNPLSSWPCLPCSYDCRLQLLCLAYTDGFLNVKKKSLVFKNKFNLFMIHCHFNTMLELDLAVLVNTFYLLD